MGRSYKFSTILGDIIRWIVALFFLPVFLYLIFLFFAYPFEWLLMISTGWSFLVHLLIWLFLGGMIISFFVSISGIIALLSTFLVRQTIAYSTVFAISLYFIIILSIAGIWFDFINFSWQHLPFETFNKILFTILILSLFKIPLEMLDASHERVA